MENYISLIIDIILAIIVIVGVCIGCKKGFAGMLVGFLGKIIAFVSACILSKIFTEIICKYIKTPVFDYITGKLQELPAASSAADMVTGFINGLPGVFGNIIGYYIGDAQSISNSIQNTTNDLIGNTALTLTDSVIMPMINLIISSLMFFVLFSVLCIIIRRVAKSMYNIKKIPVLGKINSFLGAVLGLLDGVIIVCIIALAISFLMPFAFGAGIKDINENSYILSFLGNINPFVSF